MGLINTNIDIDKLYHDTTAETHTLVVNDMSYWSEEDKLLIKRYMETVFDDTTVSLVPQCICGKVRGEFELGYVCEDCFTEVVSAFPKFKHNVWFRSEDKLFLQPKFYYILDTLFYSHSTFSLLRWISDSKYSGKPSKIMIKMMQALESTREFNRSFEWCMNNIETIIITYKSILPNKEKLRKVDTILNLYQTNKHILHSEYLPLTPKEFSIIEKTSAQFTSKGFGDRFELVMSFMHDTIKDAKKHKRDRAEAVVNHQLAMDSRVNLASTIASKEGHARQHIMSTTMIYCGYFTITPTPVGMAYDEIRLPYTGAMVLFKPMLTGYLFDKGLSLTAVKDRYLHALSNYDEELHTYLTSLIEDSEIGGLGMLVSRNPGLHRGSIVRVRCVEVDKDPLKSSMNYPLLITKLPNADFDGDRIWAVTLFDKKMWDLAEPFDPIHSMSDLDIPAAVSPLATISQPVAATIVEAIEAERVKYGLKQNV